jgi:hypothetical protein
MEEPMLEARSTAPPSRRTYHDRQPLTTRVPAELRRRLALYCVEHDVQVQDFVREALEEALGKNRGEAIPRSPARAPR